MSLEMYHDSECTQPIDGSDPDSLRSPVVEGEDFTNEKEIWIQSTDTTLEYENVSITANNDNDDTTTSGEVDVTYALDDNGSAGSYQQTLNLSDGDFEIAVKIWRRIYSPNVVEPFNNEVIEHDLYSEKYKK